jgi:hypothetical protein
MQDLSQEDRLRLLKFVCSFAWTDLKISDEERSLVRRLVERWGLTGPDRRKIEMWLEVPPEPEEVDPTEIPVAHRQLFLDHAKRVCNADGLVEGERDSLRVFAELVRS